MIDASSRGKAGLAPALFAISAAPAALRWLEAPRAARVLHLFEHAANLIDEAGDLLSLVDSEAAMGPFHLRVDGPPGGFAAWLRADSPVAITPGGLQIGPLRVDLSQPSAWAPRPDFPSLDAVAFPAIEPALVDALRRHGQRASIFWPLIEARGAGPQVLADLCGLGPGLTPAGDDFIVGCLAAMWCSGAERGKIEAIARDCAGRSTSLSLAWIRAAARGDFSQPWHTLIAALRSDPPGLIDAARPLLAQGHSSGTDSLIGFLWGLSHDLHPA